MDWLRERPADVSIVIAARAALRVLPFIQREKHHVVSADVFTRDIVLPVFRATAVAWAAAKYPAQATELASAAAAAAAAARVHPDAIIHADEARCWDVLHDRFLTKRINHQECYSDGEACTNQAESFFSRLRRAEIGIHHHISGRYL